MRRSSWHHGVLPPRSLVRARCQPQAQHVSTSDNQQQHCPSSLCLGGQRDTKNERGEDQSLMEPAAGCEVPAERYLTLRAPWAYCHLHTRMDWKPRGPTQPRPPAAQPGPQSTVHWCHRKRRWRPTATLGARHVRDKDTPLFPPAPVSDLPSGRLCTSLQTFPVLLLRKESLTSMP